MRQLFIGIYRIDQPHHWKRELEITMNFQNGGGVGFMNGNGENVMSEIYIYIPMIFLLKHFLNPMLIKIIPIFSSRMILVLKLGNSIIKISVILINKKYIYMLQ